MDLLTKISSRKANIGVVGLGYVGLPLAVEFAKVGFRVTGIDSDQQKTHKINSGESYIQNVPNIAWERLFPVNDPRLKS